MRRYIITGTILLALSMACEEKKKKKPAQTDVLSEEIILSAPVEIALPSVETASKAAISDSNEMSKSSQEKPMKMAAKVLVAPAAVKYEDVSQKVLEEGSRDEANALSLDKIREKAQQRSKELQEAAEKAEAARLAEEAQAEKVKAVAEAEAAALAAEKTDEIQLPSVEELGTRVATLDPSATQAVEEAAVEVKAAREDLSEIKSASADTKLLRTLNVQYRKAQSFAKTGQIEEAKGLFLNACQSGLAHACHKFAWYEEQAGNTANASRFYRAACDNGLGKSCNNLAFQFEQSKAYDKALDLYAKGCMERHEASCKSLKRIREEQLQESLKTR